MRSVNIQILRLQKIEIIEYIEKRTQPAVDNKRLRQVKKELLTQIMLLNIEFTAKAFFGIDRQFLGAVSSSAKC